MASGPDLFVVCKSCGAEVSPYITECPYCGNRLRKRAPKLEKGGRPREPKAPRARPTLSRLRPGEMPGVRIRSGRPYASMLLLLAPLVVTLGWKAGLWDVVELILSDPFGSRPWTLVTTTLIYDSTGYQVVALTTIFIFGWLLERRHGAWAPLLVYVLGCVAGFSLATAVDEGALATGGNAPALALVAAWAVRDLLSRRRGREDDDADMLGVFVVAAVLLLLPLAVEEASAVAGIGGGLAGLVLGLLLAKVRER
jgi:membrane associated rhomboid family serine protease